MIKLDKLEKPQVLIDNEADWTQELVRADENDEDLAAYKKRRYSHNTIRNKLNEETNEKCAYCESKLSHVVAGDIEHITPKSKRIELTYDWDNLTLACPKCNNAKNDYLNEEHPFVDPYTNEPIEEFDSYGTYICEKFGRHSAGLTIKVLKLNRAELMERRAEKIDYARQLINTRRETVDGPKLHLIEQMLLEMCSSSSEYSFIVNNFINHYGGD